MLSLIKNQPSTLTATLRADGQPVAIAPSSAVTAQLFDITSGEPLFAPAKDLEADAGDWSAGLVEVPLAPEDTAAITAPEVMLAVVVAGRPYRFRVKVEDSPAALTRSALFVRDFIVDEMRTDRLYAAMQSLLPDLKVSDDYIWQKVLAAESEVAHTLRVRLQPTAFFPVAPSPEQVEALDGMPWDVDTSYDYDPSMYTGECWGMFVTHNRPVAEVRSMQLVYPGAGGLVFDVPAEWLQVFKKYGQVQLVPTFGSSFGSLSPYMMQVVSSSRIVPNMVRMVYVAGLENPARDYPELVDAVKKKAVLKVLADAFLPQSGSISADGLSQSVSVDMSKYEDSVDVILNGPAGGNGGLMTAIHGIRTAVL
jgi:hypothetical protein